MVRFWPLCEIKILNNNSWLYVLQIISFLLTIYNRKENTNNYCAQSVASIPLHRLAIIKSVHQLYSTEIGLKSLFSADFNKIILGNKNTEVQKCKTQTLIAITRNIFNECKKLQTDRYVFKQLHKTLNENTKLYADRNILERMQKSLN